MPFYLPPNDAEDQNFEKIILKFILYIHVYHKWRSYDIWFLKYKVWQTEIFDILGHFLPFQPLDNLGNQNFNIETPRDIIILQICTINDNHIMYSSWDMERDRHNFLSFWTAFSPFTTLWTQKIKIFKKMKKNTWRLSFYKHKWVIWCTVPQIWSAMDRFFCHFGLFLALLHP